jgi:hypothetical protein
MRCENSFDLDNAIQRWREGLAQSPALRDENLNELESHLRDSISNLQTRGLSPEESFIVGCRRVGQHGLLQSEFGKVNRRELWLDRLFWTLVGFQAWTLVSGVFSLVARNGMMLAWKSLDYDWRQNGMALPVILFGLVQLLALAGSLWLCWWLMTRKADRLAGWFKPRLQRRFGLVGFGIILCGGFVLLGTFSYLFHVLLIRTEKSDVMAGLSMFSSYSSLFVSLISTVGMVVATLWLARRRIRMSQA